MRILQCMADLSPEKGGPSTAVRELSRELSALGHDVVVACHAPAGGDVARRPFAGGELWEFPLSTRLWQHSEAYRKWLRTNVRTFDFMMIHSLFLSHTYFAARVARKTGVRYAIRPHGSFTPNDMRRKARRKTAYLKLVERQGMKAASFIHCTSPQEAASVRSHGYQQIATIPLGVEGFLFQGVREASRYRKRWLFVGRLAEKKGLDLIVRAFAISGMSLDAELVVAGPDPDGRRRQLRLLAAELGVEERVRFLDFVDGEEKRELYASAGVFVLPSRDENFGLAAAEALASGLPVVLTPEVSHAPLVRGYDAGRIVTRDPRDIAQAADEISALEPAAYARMSGAASLLARENYSWPTVAARLVSEIERL